MHRCLFCEFANKETPCEIPYEDDDISTFIDWNHLDGVHVVAFLKKHIGLKDKGSAEYEELRQKLYDKVPLIAQKAKMSKDYRLMTEEGEDNVSQNLEHLHIHIIGKPAE
ncbi:MAG: HIT domain-containing protein [Lachnospiraceae bacterium]|nr:HIT domain-containing protein [Lachnospiraceae bacterium]